MRVGCTAASGEQASQKFSQNCGVIARWRPRVLRASRPMNEVIGDARVSTGGQDLGLQLDALQAAGVKRVFKDVGSGSLRSRPQLDACLERLGDGDTLIVWRLDRLGRSLRHLLSVLAELSERGVAFRSLTEAIDTTTAAGRLQVHLFAALAEFERSLGQERTAPKWRSLDQCATRQAKRLPDLRRRDARRCPTAKIGKTKRSDHGKAQGFLGPFLVLFSEPTVSGKMRCQSGSMLRSHGAAAAMRSLSDALSCWCRP